MKVVIENGGFDCSLYNIQPDSRESEQSYNNRLSTAKQELHTDLLFFNQILYTVNMVDDREELEVRMKLLFAKRLRRLLHGQERVFGYGFENGGMIVMQNDNPNPIMNIPIDKN